MSMNSHPAYFAAASGSQSPSSAWMLDRIRTGTLREQVSKRSRYLSNRLNRIPPSTRRRILIFTVVGVFFLFCIGLARAASRTLELQSNDSIQHRNLAEALRREAAKSNATLPVREDVFVYPSFPDRPLIFPNADDDHLHGRIGVDPVTQKVDWAPLKFNFKQTAEERRKAHEKYCFNTRVCAALSLDRKIPEFNSGKCLSEKYDVDHFAPADVVIVFHNEDLAALLRSIHSILNRTPPSLLGRIILVNDDSERDTHPWLFDDLPRFLEHLPKTELIHLTKRRGLMMARMEGTHRSRATTVVYLDSHIECARRWLEPMLKEITANPKRMVTPMIHSIDAETFEFEPGAVGVVGFTWTLGQTHPHRETDNYTPLISPVMAGGLFASNRDWFLELGGYDPEMKLYGGEEMEIGFKVWQCHGELYNLPCSRVGHIFRTDKYWKGQVYTVPMGEIVRNKLRAVEVWLDEYKPVAKMAMSLLPDNYTLGPLDDVLAVRERLQCKPFKWYLENIYPDLWVPDVSTYVSGSIVSPKFGFCMDTMSRDHGRIGAYPCHGQHGSQAMIMSTLTGEIRTAASAFKNCLVARHGFVEMVDCKTGATSFAFEPAEDGPGVLILGAEKDKRHPVGLIRLLENGEPTPQCLSVHREENRERSVAVSACSATDPEQRWAIGG